MAERGGTSRPSRKAWIATGTPVAAHDPHERRNVILVRMNAARRDEPHQVAAAPAFTPAAG